MSTTVTPPIVTGDDLFGLPDDGIEREFIRGQLRERPMTRRSRRHSRTTTRLARFLDSWLDKQSEPKGEILTGDAASMRKPCGIQKQSNTMRRSDPKPHSHRNRRTSRPETGLRRDLNEREDAVSTRQKSSIANTVPVDASITRKLST